MKFEIKPYSELTTNEFHDLIALRIAVFVVEQNCPYQELDGKDKKAFHLLLRDETSGILIGTLRIFGPGIAYPDCSIGRVASHPDYRNRKAGHFMMNEAMKFISKLWNNTPVCISAQSHLCKFYSAYGFVKTGHEYLEDNIPHSEMVFTPAKN